MYIHHIVLWKGDVHVHCCISYDLLNRSPSDNRSRHRSKSRTRPLRKRDEVVNITGDQVARSETTRRLSRSRFVPRPSTRYPSNYCHKIDSTTDNDENNSTNPHEIRSANESQETSATDDRPISHASQQPPICNACLKRNVTFFNVDCDNCWYTLKRGNLSPAQVFAVLRVWVSRVQRNIGPLVGLVSVQIHQKLGKYIIIYSNMYVSIVNTIYEIFVNLHNFFYQAIRGGCGINDRDSVTDMTLLHYAVKSGARGVGDPTVAIQVSVYSFLMSVS